MNTFCTLKTLLAFYSLLALVASQSYPPLPTYHHGQNPYPVSAWSQRRIFGRWFGSSALSRQIFDMLDIVTDVAMLTLLGIPVLGLVAIGASIFGPAVPSGNQGGLAAAPTATTTAETTFSPQNASRTKRELDFLSQAEKVLEHFQEVFEALNELEKVFDKYKIQGKDCKRKIVCEAHRKNLQSTLYEDIRIPVSIQRNLVETETLPLSKILFHVYIQAAKLGTNDGNCSEGYKECPLSIEDFVNRPS